MTTERITARVVGAQPSFERPSTVQFSLGREVPGLDILSVNVDMLAVDGIAAVKGEAVAMTLDTSVYEEGLLKPHDFRIVDSAPAYLTGHLVYL